MGFFILLRFKTITKVQGSGDMSLLSIWFTFVNSTIMIEIK